MMPEDGLDQIKSHDAIFLGAVGWPAGAGPRLALGPADPDPPRTSTSTPTCARSA